MLTRWDGVAVTSVVIAVAATGPAAGDPAWAGWLGPAELSYAAGRGRAVEHLTARRLAKQATLRRRRLDRRSRRGRTCEVVRTDGHAPVLTVDGGLGSLVRRAGRRRRRGVD